MVFSSIVFLCYFLPISLFLYFVVPQKYKNAVLLFVSLLFYSFGDLSALPILLLSIAINHFFAKKICTSEKSKRYLVWAILLNVLILIYGKYFSFIVQNLSYIDTRILKLEEFSILLPIGISFFTFQGISYVIDVYRKDAKPSKNFWDTALYISMFPQLIAGPIVRYSTIVEQIDSRELSVQNFYTGLQFFIAGLAQKVFLANNMAVVADYIFASPLDDISTSVAWVGAIAYSLQILFDFSGYSIMAIGLGYIFGFTFPPNFNYPYVSASITEFWRRWHMSLSSWIRDYLYIPLGGSRKGSVRTYMNLMIVFSICGIWHGASWNFLVWGWFHGSLLVVERLFLHRMLNKTPKVLCHVYTLLMVCIGWVLFRSDSLSVAIEYLKRMFGFTHAINDYNVFYYIDNGAVFFAGMACLFAVPLWKKLFLSSKNLVDSQHPESYLLIYKSCKVEIAALSILISLLVLSIIFIGAGSHNPFIYFRF